MNATRDNDTTELNIATSKSAPRAPFSSLIQVDLGGLSHQGLVRQNNEDHFLITRFGRYFEPLETNLPEANRVSRLDETGYALAVADGVGGRAGGEVASRVAIQMLVNLVLNTPDWILVLDDDVLAQEVERRAVERWGEVNAALADYASGDPGLEGYSTTLTLAWSLGRDLFVAHVGDSRAYVLRGKTLHQLTRDHTLAQVLADQGIIASQAVVAHRYRRVLTKALSGKVRGNEPDVQRLTLQDCDCLLLCTDGLTEMVPDERIAKILENSKTAQRACQTLVDEALNAGGNDNVTVAMARYQLPQA